MKVLEELIFKVISALLLSTVVVSGVNIPFSSVVGVNSTTAYAKVMKVLVLRMELLFQK
ncbi:MAG: hypothetical protein E6269_00355 [Clostridiales bacterium]|nr:hypothetical protein [Clostridiales bacterium]